MANIFNTTAGLPVARDGTEDSGNNIFHISAGLPPSVESAPSGSGWAHKLYGVSPAKINGITVANIAKVGGA